MNTFEFAREYVAAFHNDSHNPNLSPGEAELHDLALLRDAVEEHIIARANELVRFEGLSWTAVTAALHSCPSSVRRRYLRGGASNE
ncbi:hypothetical protein [Trueperella sp. LYQ141]|uniref:hypothetical protein n=1 Tax=Trueperella sp. LYQ141 TaxID=3391058 RepID=UPI0039830786